MQVLSSQQLHAGVLAAGVRITKPFVEKPGSAEDHNVHIYYPSSMVRGGAGAA
jgi:hypothetical protein